MVHSIFTQSQGILQAVIFKYDKHLNVMLLATKGWEILS